MDIGKQCLPPVNVVYFYTLSGYSVDKPSTQSIKYQSMSTLNSSANTDTLSLFKKQYSVDRVLANAGSGPMIAVSIDELDLSNNPVTHSNSERAENKIGSIVLYKHEGRYIVILGYDRAIRLRDGTDTVKPATNIKGRLLTKHGLKKSLVDDNPQETAQQLEYQIRSSFEPIGHRPYREERPRQDYRENRSMHSQRDDIRPAYGQSTPRPPQNNQQRPNPAPRVQQDNRQPQFNQQRSQAPQGRDFVPQQRPFVPHQNTNRSDSPNKPNVPVNRPRIVEQFSDVPGTNKKPSSPRGE